MESIGIKGHALAIAPSITMLMRDLDSMAMESASRQYSVPVKILYFSAASSQDKGVFKTILCRRKSRLILGKSRSALREKCQVHAVVIPGC